MSILSSRYASRGVARAFFTALAAGSFVACSGSDGGASSSSPFEAPDSGADAAVGSPADGGGGASHDAAPPRPTFVSNTPGATVRDDSSPAQPTLVLVSSNFLQSPSGGQYFQEWLGEIANAGSDVACYVRTDVSFLDAGGAQLAKFTSFADAAPYADASASSTLSMPCIAPGATGVFYANGFAATAAPIASTATIALKLSASSYPGAVPHPDAPTVMGATPTVGLGGGSMQLAGSLVGGPKPINNISLRVYPIDPIGLAMKQLTATDLGTLAAGGSWPFQTDYVQGSFTKYRLYADFIDGAAQNAPVPALESARRALRREQDARAAEARLDSSR